MPTRTNKAPVTFTTTLVAVVVALIFLYWLLSVLLPVAKIEAKYQYKKILREKFSSESIRGVFLPDLTFNLTGYTSRNTENGLTIPALFVDEPIIYNVDPNNEKAYGTALRSGIAHASGTAFPGSGGTGYYFAHSSYPDVIRQSNAVFYLLGKLKEGDDVYLWHEGKRAEYKVFKKEETDPGDVSFLTSDYPKETIILQTCWPPGSTVRRLLVYAALTDATD